MNDGGPKDIPKDMTLTEALHVLKSATCPEDIFGTLPENLDAEFRDWSKRVHPDLHRGHRDAEEAFKLLGEIYVEAQAKVGSRTYGRKTALSKPLTITSGRTKYLVTDRLAFGTIADLYLDAPAFPDLHAIKVVRNPRNNDLMKNEADVLREIHGGPVGKLKIAQHVPVLADSFELVEGKARRRVNVFKCLVGFHTLRQVMDAYPKGLDPRDAAWMFNRLLAALLACHQAGYVHGAVTPDNFLIRPKDHHGVLVDLCYAVKAGNPLKAIAGDRNAYPADALEKRPTDFGVDLHMAAGIFLQLTDKFAGWRPGALLGLMRACRLGKAHRTKDVYELHKDFAEVLKAIYGSKKFRQFVMPTTAGATSR